jgi:hypothetical protein
MIRHPAIRFAEHLSDGHDLAQNRGIDGHTLG